LKANGTVMMRLQYFVQEEIAPNPSEVSSCNKCFIANLFFSVTVNENVMRMWLLIFSFMHQLLHFAKTVICSGVFASLTVKHEKVVLTTGH